MRNMNILARFLTFRTELVTLWRAFLAPETPLHLKALMLLVPLYLLSPLDLIPDVVPVLGWLDDLIIVPLGILLVVKLIPEPLMAEYREMATGRAKQRSYGGMAAVLAIWIGAGAALLYWLWPGSSF